MSNKLNETFQKHLGLLNKKINEVTTESNEPDDLIPDGLMGAVVNHVDPENGIVYIRLDGKTKDGRVTMFEARLT
jgi:hypothetical protein